MKPAAVNINVPFKIERLELLLIRFVLALIRYLIIFVPSYFMRQTLFLIKNIIKGLTKKNVNDKLLKVNPIKILGIKILGIKLVGINE